MYKVICEYYSNTVVSSNKASGCASVPYNMASNNVLVTYDEDESFMLSTILCLLRKKTSGIAIIMNCNDQTTLPMNSRGEK